MQGRGAKAVDAASIKEGNITGTNKDLRRLSMVASQNLLLKLGLAEGDIKGDFSYIYSWSPATLRKKDGFGCILA